MPRSKQVNTLLYQVKTQTHTVSWGRLPSQPKSLAGDQVSIILSYRHRGVPKYLARL